MEPTLARQRNLIPRINSRANLRQEVTGFFRFFVLFDAVLHGAFILSFRCPTERCVTAPIHFLLLSLAAASFGVSKVFVVDLCVGLASCFLSRFVLFFLIFWILFFGCAALGALLALEGPLEHARDFGGTPTLAVFDNQTIVSVVEQQVHSLRDLWPAEVNRNFLSQAVASVIKRVMATGAEACNFARSASAST